MQGNKYDHPVQLTRSWFGAHSLPQRPQEDWETLAHHASPVADLADQFASIFGCAGMARAAGLLHDAGKCSAAFQVYLSHATSTGRVDRSTKGARIVQALYGGNIGRILGLCIAGHHAGLADPAELDRRLDLAHAIPSADAWAAHITAPERSALQPTRHLWPDNRICQRKVLSMVRNGASRESGKLC